uniref:Uncharacterized protein n=1 Tax=Lepeophtheirus salmonis TaxID=72036 RepID=A0A0K2UIY4_LEPSM
MSPISSLARRYFYYITQPFIQKETEKGPKSSGS